MLPLLLSMALGAEPVRLTANTASSASPATLKAASSPVVVATFEVPSGYVATDQSTEYKATDQSTEYQATDQSTEVQATDQSTELRPGRYEVVCGPASSCVVRSSAGQVVGGLGAARVDVATREVSWPATRLQVAGSKLRLAWVPAKAVYDVFSRWQVTAR